MLILSAGMGPCCHLLGGRTIMLWRLPVSVALVFAALGAAPAHAAWHKAESDRFVIYSDSRADDLKDFAETLERYHVAMTLESGRQVPVPSPSNRLTVFMVGSLDDLREVYGNRNSNVGGFYMARANGSVTFVPNIRVRSRNSGRDAPIGSRLPRSNGNAIDPSLSVLLHEYAHHFLISSARHAMPRWLSEGAAEYFASARFNEDGSVDIGLPNNDRAWEISQAANVSLTELLGYEEYRKNRSRRYDAYYGRSWLLFHYLRFSPERSGQLVEYWQAVASGVDSIQAAKSVFGDLDQLEQELSKYGRQRKMVGMRFNAEDISIGSVSTSKLSPGHAAMMEVIIQSKRGVDEEEAAMLVLEAREIAERFLDDARALTALAEAEYDAGNDDRALAAANRAIAADRTIKNAYVQKGYALFRKAEVAEDKQAAYVAAMQPFEALNAIESDHTQPLIYYYRSFTKRGVAPPEGARHAIERATQLAPFDKELAMEVAALKASEGESDIARYLLGPVAGDPHGGKRATTAQLMIDYLETVPNGQRVSFGELFQKLDTENEGGEAEE